MSAISQLNSLYRQAYALREKMYGEHPTLRSKEDATKAHTDFCSQIRRVEWLVEVWSVRRSEDRNTVRFYITSHIRSGFWFFRETATVSIYATQEVYNGISLLDLSKGQELIVKGTLIGMPGQEENSCCLRVGLDLESLSLR